MSSFVEGPVIGGAEPFFLSAGENGCLLIHGIAGTPQVFRLMGDSLAREGITVAAVRLKGHATRIEDLHLCSYQDWIDSAEEELLKLSEQCSKVFVAGLSMGGVISLRLARLHPELVKGVVTICSPYKLDSFKFRFVPLAGRFIKKIAGGPPSILDPNAVEINYRHHSVPAVHELIKLTSLVREDLAHIKQPALIFTALKDNVVNKHDGQRFYDALGSESKELVVLNNSHHIATLDYDKEILFKKTAAFIKQHSL